MNALRERSQDNWFQDLEISHSLQLSPSLNACGFWLLGYLKRADFVKRNTIVELKNCIRDDIAAILSFNLPQNKIWSFI